MINGWHGIAFNQAPDSANEIHGDRIAKQYGFRGGLVPGVTISAYLIHPAVEAWGMEFLNRGAAHVRVGSPVYDEEAFEVRICEQTENSYRAEICQPDGTVSASADVSLPELAAAAPVRRGDELADKHYKPPQSSPEVFEQLRDEGCKAFRYRWKDEHNMRTYVREAEQMPALYGTEGYANMGFLLGCSNWSLASNARMNPWVHLETRSQNYRAVPLGTALIAEMGVRDFYEKKGHKFVDTTINLFDEQDEECVTSIELRAIYRLRGL